MNKIKLKPCPFCGSNDIKTIKNGADWYSGVACSAKGCELNVYFFKDGINVSHTADLSDKAIREAWNKRI